ncbi:6-O-methylguanine DNA methyltransferase [Podospora didyma]|uniref:Methylated-DNA--protein-cysteine methyltransferase n=1 Tax=Podospora didyma TaxID=330526 RepID=A0AAE0NTQ2_9PEZI|nr:6-O-methylguanine DNA methyltransferase [Podospora didyma]
MTVGTKRKLVAISNGQPDQVPLSLAITATTTSQFDSARPSASSPPSDMTDLHSLITKSPRGTPFEKNVWLLLLQIPPGSVSTYGILAAHLRSSPRAVGNALRRNPFAPAVPCHRVVATGGALGGFKGKIGRRDGEASDTLVEKRMLLRKEGVRFSSSGSGSVLGTPFMGFV